MTREERMNKRREAGKTYSYKPNPFVKGSEGWREEQYKRTNKNVSRKTPTARWTSIMAKLENQLVKERLEKAKQKRKRGVVNA